MILCNVKYKVIQIRYT